MRIRIVPPYVDTWNFTLFGSSLQGRITFRRGQSCQYLDNRALARSIGTKQAKNFTFVHPKTNMIDRSMVAEALHQLLNLYDCSHIFSHLSSIVCVLHGDSYLLRNICCLQDAFEEPLQRLLLALVKWSEQVRKQRTSLLLPRLHSCAPLFG